METAESQREDDHQLPTWNPGPLGLPGSPPGWGRGSSSTAHAHGRESLAIVTRIHTSKTRWAHPHKTPKAFSQQPSDVPTPKNKGRQKLKPKHSLLIAAPFAVRTDFLSLWEVAKCHTANESKLCSYASEPQTRGFAYQSPCDLSITPECVPSNKKFPRFTLHVTAAVPRNFRGR